MMIFYFYAPSPKFYSHLRLYLYTEWALHRPLMIINACGTLGGLENTNLLKHFNIKTLYLS
jgi:hypothetical protein